MGVVSLSAAVSLDGHVGRDDDVAGPRFDRYGDGEVEVVLGDPDRRPAAHRPRALPRPRRPGGGRMTTGSTTSGAEVRR